MNPDNQNTTQSQPMSLQAFGQRIKQKYPQYNDLQDEDVANKVLTKYPQYSDMVSQDNSNDQSTQQSQSNNVFSQLGLQPQADAAEQLPNQVGEGLAGIFGGKQIGTALGQGLFNLFNPKSASPITPTGGQIAGDALQSGANIASLGTGMPEGLLARLGVNAGLGVANRIGAGLQNNESAGQMASTLPTTATASALLPEVAGGAINKAGELLNALGTKIQTSVIRPTARDVADGFSIENLNKYNLGGSLQQSLIKSTQKLNDLSSQLSEKIKSTPEAQVNLNDVYDQTAKDLTASKTKNFGHYKQLDNVLTNLKGEIANVTQTGSVDLAAAQDIKRGAGTMGAWQFGVPAPEATATEKVYNTFYNKIKTAIEQNAPEGIKSINQQLSDIIPIHNAIIKRIPVAERNNAISLSDAMALGGSLVDPRALALFAGNKALKSGRVGNLLQKISPNLAEKLPAPISRLGKTSFLDLLAGSQNQAPSGQ